MPAAARTRIGGRRGAHAAVGRGATLGGSFLAVEWDVAIEVRARSMDDLARFLPGGEMHRLLGQAVRAALPAHLDWEARVTIDEAAVEPARLGGTRLGQTGWMAPRRRGGVTRTDVRLRPSGREAPVAA